MLQLKKKTLKISVLQNKGLQQTPHKSCTGEVLCLVQALGIEAEGTITVLNLPGGDSKVKGSGRLSMLLLAVDPCLLCLPPHGHSCGPIHTRLWKFSLPPGPGKRRHQLC